MPNYDFENQNDKTIETHMMKIAEKDKFLKDNPHLKQVILTPPGIDYDGGKSVLSRAGDGWKEVQDKIKSNLPPRLRDNIKTK